MTCGDVQGMNFIAGCLLLFMDEEDTFWCLAIIVEELLPGYYSMAMVEPQVCSHKLPTSIPASCHPAQNTPPEPGGTHFICKSPQPTVMHHQEGLQHKLVRWLYHIHATCRTPARYGLFVNFLKAQDDAKNDWSRETMPTTDHSYDGYAAHSTGHSGQRITLRACFDCWLC